MGYHLLPADTLGYADHIRPDTMGILPASEMGRCMGKVDDTLSDRPFLWSDVVLRRFLCPPALRYSIVHTGGESDCHHTK